MTLNFEDESSVGGDFVCFIVIGNDLEPLRFLMILRMFHD